MSTSSREKSGWNGQNKDSSLKLAEREAGNEWLGKRWSWVRCRDFFIRDERLYYKRSPAGFHHLLLPPPHTRQTSCGFEQLTVPCSSIHICRGPAMSEALHFAFQCLKTCKIWSRFDFSLTGPNLPPSNHSSLSSGATHNIRSISFIQLPFF